MSAKTKLTSYLKSLKSTNDINQLDQLFIDHHVLTRTFKDYNNKDYDENIHNIKSHKIKRIIILTLALLAMENFPCSDLGSI